MNKLMRHILTVLPAVLLQILWLVIVFYWLAPWAGVISVVLSVLALFFVLYIFTKQDETSYKILWLLIILTFPIPGALLYLIFGNKRTTRPLKKKMEKAPPLPPDTCDSSPLHSEMANHNKRLSQTFRWVEQKTGYPLRVNRGATYYPLGDTMFPDMLEELRKAERFIFLEYFIVNNGKMWGQIEAILAEKAAQGVDVRMLYDDLGSISTFTKQDANELNKKGIRCVVFNPLVIIKGTLNCRDHRKMLIVDGKVVFSGGINLADEYINEYEKYGHWKDIGFKLTGEAVRNYTRMFAEFWNAYAGDTLPAEYLTPPSDTPSGETDGLVLSYYDSPIKNDAISNELYIDLLSQAKETAWFFTPYLLPGEALLNAFRRAARRGVDIRIIMPGIPDKKLVFRMSRSFYPLLLEAGVKIYEYTPGFVHAKACLVDGTVGTVGTVNLDFRSLFLHFENNSLFAGASILRDVQADFLATQEKCQERTLQNIGKGFGKWLIDGILRIFAPLC